MPANIMLCRRCCTSVHVQDAPRTTGTSGSEMDNIICEYVN